MRLKRLSVATLVTLALFTSGCLEYVADFKRARQLQNSPAVNKQSEAVADCLSTVLAETTRLVTADDFVAAAVRCGIHLFGAKQMEGAMGAAGLTVAPPPSTPEAPPAFPPSSPPAPAVERKAVTR